MIWFHMVSYALDWRELVIGLDLNMCTLELRLGSELELELGLGWRLDVLEVGALCGYQMGSTFHPRKQPNCGLVQQV